MAAEDATSRNFKKCRLALNLVNADPGNKNLMRRQPRGSKAKGLWLRVVDLRKGFCPRMGSDSRSCVVSLLKLRVGNFAITGASGSGKSTLLHLLGALEEPDHGSISLEKTDLASLKADGLAELRQGSIGFVFQFHYLLSDLTAAENVGLPLQISRENSASIQTKVANY